MSPGRTGQATSATLAFCPACGNLLDPPGNDDFVVCNLCHHSRDAKDFEELETVTRSRADAFESALRKKRSVITGITGEREEAATIQEACPKCRAPEMSFHTMQLRSADEGQTVFYNCKKCGYKYSINS